MFGLFDPGSRPTESNQLEQRVFCFGPDRAHKDKLPSLDDLRDVIEIRVFRSKGRKRIKPEVGGVQTIPGKTDTDRTKSQLHSKENGVKYALIMTNLRPKSKIPYQKD